MSVKIATYIKPKCDGSGTNIDTSKFATKQELKRVEGVVDDVSSQLEHNTNYIDIKNLNTVTIHNLNLFDERIFSNKEYSIQDVFPNVTLSEVQTIQSDATLNDSADWYVVMKLINYAHANDVGYIQLPKGEGMLSRTIDLTKKLYKCTILGKKTCLKASNNGFVGDAIIKLSPGTTNTNWMTSRQVTLDGLCINGNHVEGIIGVFIDKAQEWLLSNCIINNCFIGIGIADSWYGEVSNESIIQDCVRGVEFLIGTSSEVNTIKFNNLKINCTLNLENRKKLAQININETDNEYNLRVPTVGFRVRTKTGGIEFNGCTIEGQEIGLLFEGRNTNEDSDLGTNGINLGIFNVDNCYFEAINKQFFKIANITDKGIKVRYIANFSNCRFMGKPKENSIFELGSLSVRSCQHIEVDLYATHSRTSVTYNDSWTINNMSNSEQIIIDSSVVPINANPLKYNNFGVTDVYPKKGTMYPSVQGEQYIRMIHPIINELFDNHKMMQVTNTSMVFMPSSNDKCGLVIKGDDNNFYMLQIDVNGNLVPRKLLSYKQAIPSNTQYNLRYLWTIREKVITPCNTTHFDNLYFENNSGHEVFYTKDDSNKYPRIMKHTSYLIKDSLGYSTITGQSFIHLIDLGINIRGDNDKYVDWYGRFYDLLCVGTISQRPNEVPTEAVGFKYISTDEGKIYEWDMIKKQYKEFIAYDTDK